VVNDWLRALIGRPCHHVGEVEFAAVSRWSGPTRLHSGGFGQIALPAKTGLKRSETAEPPALRIKQSAEKWNPIKVRDTKPVDGTVGGYQSSGSPVTDYAMPVDRRKRSRSILREVHSGLKNRCPGSRRHSECPAMCVRSEKPRHCCS
jgi:hypothetical protein